MKAVILAGGLGTRLLPLTETTPKPLVPLQNKPVMEYSIELLKKHGITEIIVTICYLSEKIKNYFGDGSKWGVHITYVEEIEPLGTAGCVKFAKIFLEDTFLVISGDALTDFNLQKGIDFHEKHDALMTIFMAKTKYPTYYGIMKVNADGEIIAFKEKPKSNEVFSNIVNTGIYVVNPKIFSYFPNKEAVDFSKDILPILLQNGSKIIGYLAEGYWIDIGNHAQYEQAKEDLKQNKVSVIENEGQMFSTRLWKMIMKKKQKKKEIK
ncbi:nucleotidyltransferase family protein [Bacillus sp. FJAT-45066]|uniref:nucleotidyltransferase family protein n=1 Tax=Bacillus sp. FJAT-45066 TaxID=2011010 RepID=UPI001596CD6C|nr:nucleotidyltransferase family protein [Bacillus sp. FJAT-45066]